MVDFAKAHHPSNCLTLNNRNRFGDGSVAAQTKDIPSHSIGHDNIIIDSVGWNENDRSNCKRLHGRPRRCIINDNIEPYNCRRANVPFYQCNGGSRKKISQDAGWWFRIRTTVNSSNLSVSIIFCAAISLLLLNIDVIKAEPQQTTEQQCEPKVFEETPADPVSIQQSMVIFYFSFQ